MPLADYLPWKIAEARRAKNGIAVAARSDPAPDVLPNRTGFVQGVPQQGFGEDDAASSTGTAQNTTRQEFLQELWEEYVKCPWAFASVNSIARTVTAGGLVMKWDGDTGQYGQKQPDKPPEVLALERLLAFTNPAQDIRQLCRAIVADLQVFSGAMVEVVWFAGIPVALYIQDFPTTWPETDPHGNITGYKQRTEDGRTADFTPEQIIYITLDSARPSIFGISPTHAAEESIVAWMYLHACEKEAARRGLPPNVHVDHPAGTPDTDVTKWQNQYAVRNIGPSNIGTPITTKGGGKVAELQQAKLSEILASKQAARDEIVCTYGVPPAKLGIIESGNLGGGTGSDQNKTFMLDVVRPIAMLIAEKLQFALAVKAFGIKGWHVEFPTTDYRDDKVIADIQDQQVRLGARTLNDLRRELGRPPVDGGDDAVLIARQDIVLWQDLAARSAASVSGLGGVDSVGDIPQPARSRTRPGPPPAIGTAPSKGPGGARSESVAEHTAALGARERVYNQLSRRFPDSALKWVLDPKVSSWDGPTFIHPDQVDTDDMRQWTAAHDDAKVARIRKRLRKTGRMKPIVVVRAPGSEKDIIADGHHHALAAIREGRPIRAYIGHVHTVRGPWQTMSTRQKRESAPNRNHDRISKAEAGYQKAVEPGVRCGTCVMWDDQRCSLVQGDIAIDAVCEHWEAKPKPDGGQAA